MSIEYTYESSQSMTRVRIAISNCRRDLWNARLPGVWGALFEPLRFYALDPAVAFAARVLPPVAGAVPGAESVLRAAIWAMFLPIRPFAAFQGSVAAETAPGEGTDDDDDDGPRHRCGPLRTAAPRDDVLSRVPRFRPPSDLSSAIRGTLAFACSAAVDVIGALREPEKMRTWMKALTDFRAYLDATGVANELEESLWRPLVRGRLLCNLKILNDVQELRDADRCERCKKECPEKDVTRAIVEGQRIMRFATAAYGTEMIRSALDRDAGAEELEDERKAIAFHTNVSEENVKILCVKNGGSMSGLCHFVAVDHKNKSVVLALRGTLSVSEALIDVQAMDRDFCFGRAHKGISEMADNVWEESGENIKSLLMDEEQNDYTFVITGHSLGAGTACLLNLKLHVEKPLGDRPVKCYGFAPPPTFFSLVGIDAKNASAVDAAIKNTVCYIHDNDCVPHLSLSSIRRLSSLLDMVDDHTQQMWFTRRFRLFWEVEPIPMSLIDAVDNVGKEATRAADVPTVSIPAHMVLWMKYIAPGSFQAHCCCPHAVSCINIFMNQDMINDHMPERYENALDSIASEANKKILASMDH